MQTLTFKVEGQRLERTDKLKPVAGSKNLLRCEFSLDPEWDGMRVAARFLRDGHENAVILEDRACDIPASATKGRWFKVALMGKDGSTVITTNAVTVFQEAM